MAKMTYEEWLAGSIRLSSNVDMLENELNFVTQTIMDQLGVQRASNGLLPRELTKSEKYQEANQKFNMGYNLYKEFDTPPRKQGGFFFHSLAGYLKRSIRAVYPTVSYVFRSISISVIAMPTSRTYKLSL